MTKLNYVFTKYYYGKGEDSDEAWKNASKRESINYDDADVDDYQNQLEKEAGERRVTS